MDQIRDQVLGLLAKAFEARGLVFESRDNGYTVEGVATVIWEGGRTVSVRRIGALKPSSHFFVFDPRGSFACASYLGAQLRNWKATQPLRDARRGEFFEGMPERCAGPRWSTDAGTVEVRYDGGPLAYLTCPPEVLREVLAMAGVREFER